MAKSFIPTEVELVFEVMPCNAQRAVQEVTTTHPCTYFQKWGTYHAYDYEESGPPAEHDIGAAADYLGRAPLLPELVSGCRKAPILAVGINPNLPAWEANKRNSAYPLFDDYRQYAHYFRYRTTDKLQIKEAKYLQYGGGPADTPFSGFVLNVPLDAGGRRRLPLEHQPQTMYETYQSLLDALAEAMADDWPNTHFTVGEDLAYGNMVACPSARWTVKPIDGDPNLPPMTIAERDGIVGECFRKRRYFLRQLFQSLPAVILVFSQSTANAFIVEMSGRFSVGQPTLGDRVEDLLDKEVRLHFADLPDGSPLDARVVFSPHITGSPAEFAAARDRVVAQVVAEARSPGTRLTFNRTTGRLSRTVGSCLFCPMLDIGPCDYETELRSLEEGPALTALSPVAHLKDEKLSQEAMLTAFIARGQAPGSWEGTDES
jgi:hypothetical protein